MPDMLTRRKVFTAKVEGTKGVDAVPTVVDDLIIPNGDLNVAVPTEQDAGDGDLKGTFGPGESITLKQALQTEVTSRVRGLGQGATARLVPDLHPLLIGSGHKVTTSGDGAATPRSAQYKPTSNPAELASFSAYAYEDGLLYKLLGCANSLSFEASMAVLMAKASIQAPYAVPTVVALPAVTMPDEEIFRMTATLCAVTEGGAAVKIGSFTFDPGVEVQEAYETGAHFFEVANRNPTIAIDPRAVATAADWNALTNAASVAIVATFTNSLGETLVFSAPKCVPTEVSAGDRAGRITRQKKFSLKETTGDDQYTITWTSVL